MGWGSIIHEPTLQSSRNCAGYILYQQRQLSQQEVAVKEHQSADEAIRAEKLNGHLNRQAECMYCVHLLVL
jgi:hypothetical protein